MHDRLPPLKTLEGFEAAARLGSFAAAADELGLTQSAISHQIRSLERALDQPLFRRIHRQVTLTDAGRDFQRTVGNMLRGLREGVSRLAPYRKPNSVILYCDHSFAECWLMPRLPRLIADLPQVDIWLDSSAAAIDLDRTEVDILISLEDVAEGDDGNENHDANVAPHLLSLDFRPFARTDIAQALDGNITYDALKLHSALHLEGKISWSTWLARINDAPLDTDRLDAGPSFSESRSLLIAISQGLGLGLAPTLFAAPFVENGTIAAVGEQIWRAARSYRITVHHEPEDEAFVLPVYEWLIAEAAVQAPDR